VRKVTPEPHVPIFGPVDDNDAMNKPTKRTRYSIWNDRNIYQKPTIWNDQNVFQKPTIWNDRNIFQMPNLSYVRSQENNSAAVTTTSRALTSVPKPFYTKMSAIALKKLYKQGLGQPDPAINFQQDVHPSYCDFSVTQKNSKTLTLREFLALWDECLLKLGRFQCTEDIEKQHSFREASLKCNAVNQDTAHYGRTRFEACQVSFERSFLVDTKILVALLLNSLYCRKFSS
jgi:hypothetical protein